MSSQLNAPAAEVGEESMSSPITAPVVSQVRLELAVLHIPGATRSDLTASLTLLPSLLSHCFWISFSHQLVKTDVALQSRDLLEDSSHWGASPSHCGFGQTPEGAVDFPL